MARRGFMDLLVIPWVDKTIAILAVLPFAAELLKASPRLKQTRQAGPHFERVSPV